MSNKKDFPGWKRGDRRDGVRLRGVDSMHAFMPYLLPDRADNEAVMRETVDLSTVNAYLAAKNAEHPEFRYTIFHIISAALIKVFEQYPKLNRFYSGKRFYQRRETSLTFTIKKQFTETSEEAMAILFFGGDGEAAPLVQFREQLYRQLHSVRDLDVADESTAMMDVLTKLPRWALRIVMGGLNFLEYHGKVPDSVWRGDPYHCSVFVSNLGSIKMHADYHHLSNWGTNSVFVIIGEKYRRPVPLEAGGEEVREMLDLGITVDERIADGLYFAKCIKFLQYLLAHPELLELPLREKVEWEKEAVLA